ncbi:MAG: D-alanyl-D-alanine carboxypeptidase/D-alanyl-D-alanine-endopeptidase [Syntrophobacterales bacterium]|nr:D-alanyl-D-alanine carboxypeptidase/D-alanyl-D-alanine-endopeptidase [Syntrophobacterales bacterium]
MAYLRLTLVAVFALITSKGWCGSNALFSPSASQVFVREWATAKSEISGDADLCGIEIRRLPDGQVLLSENNHVPLVAASLTKVLTSLAALKKLGPDHVFRTEFRGQRPQNGVIQGNLFVVSDGNPLWFSKDLKYCVESFVSTLGIKAIQGGIIVDQRFFLPSVERLCLDGKCHKSYNPTISAVAVDFNTLTISVYPGQKIGERARVGWGESWVTPIPLRNLTKTVSQKQRTALSLRLKLESGELVGVLSGNISIKDKCGTTLAIKLDDPSKIISGAVKNLLLANRVKIGSSVMPIQGEGLTTIFSCRTPTLAEVLHGINRHSNNFMAEMLLRHLGGEVMGAPGTREKGIKVVSGVLQDIGVPLREFYLDSGSGLSYTTKASPAAFGLALTYLYNNPPFRDPFLASLAENGREGTLRRHWVGAPFRVKGKTGTLARAVGFSGYVFWEDDAPPFAITYICNNVSKTWKVRQVMDKFVWKTAMALKRL